MTGGLVIGFNSINKAIAAEVVNTATLGHDFNSYLSISPSGTITIFSPNPEIGQGIKTAFPVIVAEELDVDFKSVNVEQANFSDKFDRQVTGGSGAIRHSWDRLRVAGATAREILKMAAAQKWNVNISELKTKNGWVLRP